MYRHSLKLVFIAWISISHAAGQTLTLHSPLDFPLFLAGNFGELRNNHFHSGIDFKTQHAVGKTVRAVKKGYVARISVSPYGYGNALYINHPDSTTTVYGHLMQFADSIAAFVKAQQYKQESFEIDLTLPPGQFAVSEGQAIAFSGNTGNSGGPHVHFEIRDTQTQELLDPLPYFKSHLKDTKAPSIQTVLIYPKEGKGIVNGRTTVQKFAVVNRNETLSIPTPIQAWGEIAFAVKAYDYMDGTNNIYGIRKITLSADSTTLFESDLDRFAFRENRYLNSFVDFHEWRANRSFYMKSFIEPGNKLRFMQANGRGTLVIHTPGTYHLTYLVSDIHGNTTTLRFEIEGQEQSIPEPDRQGKEFFPFYTDNRFGAKGIRLFIPKGNLYEDLYFNYAVSGDTSALAFHHRLHDRYIPLHQSGLLSVKLQRDELNNKAQYGVVRIQDGRISWVGGTYRNGWIDVFIRELGEYTAAIDSTAPRIKPVSPELWAKRRRIVFAISDNLSGIKTYRGTIDGMFALFELDGKTGTLSCRLDTAQMGKGPHDLELVVTDACGNEAKHTKKLTF